MKITLSKWTSLAAIDDGWPLFWMQKLVLQRKLHLAQISQTNQFDPLASKQKQGTCT